MKKELRIFFTALMFFTRLPVPRITDHSPEYLEKSSKYFPLVGWIIGAISCAAFLVSYQFLSLETSLLVSIIAGILTTGAFHEDGFADTCDAFGGGWTKQKILEIMKDSRLGTYGTIGLVVILSLKFLLLRDLILLISLPKESFYLSVIVCFLTAHSLSRMMSVISIQFFPYVTPDDVSKSKPSAAQQLSVTSFIIAVVFALAGFLFLPIQFLLIIPALLLFTIMLNRYFVKWIGGHTGDCLGSVQQTTELLCYLMMLILWKYT